MNARASAETERFSTFTINAPKGVRGWRITWFTWLMRVGAAIKVLRIRIGRGGVTPNQVLVDWHWPFDNLRKGFLSLCYDVTLLALVYHFILLCWIFGSSGWGRKCGGVCVCVWGGGWGEETKRSSHRREDINEVCFFIAKLLSCAHKAWPMNKFISLFLWWFASCVSLDHWGVGCST